MFSTFIFSETGLVSQWQNCLQRSFLPEWRSHCLNVLAQVERFWMQSNAVVAVLASLGLSSLFSLGEALANNTRVLRSLEWLVAVILVTGQIYSNYR